MQKDMEGFNNTVKNLIKHSETNENLKKKFIGVVANIIEVPKMFETAIELALGGALQNVVTENEDDVNKLIDYLKEKDLGRATFLPLTSVKPKFIDDRYLSKIKLNGCYGVAKDLIKFDSKFTKIFDNLLGSTVVVNDLPLAISLAKECNYSFKIVTLTGDIINPTGSISGGSKKNNASSLIGRNREIEEIELHLTKLNKELDENVIYKNTLNKTCEELQQNIKDTNSSLHALELEVVTNTEKLTVTKNASLDSENIIKNLKENEKTLNINISNLDNEILELETIIASINTNKTSTNNAITKTQEQFSNLKEERNNYNEKITTIRVEVATLNSENLSLSEEELRINNEINEKQTEIADLKENLQKLSLTKQNLLSKLDLIKQNENYRECENEINVVKGKLDNLDSYKQQLQVNLKELDEDRINFTNQITKLQNKQNLEELNLTKIDTELENMQERIWDEYELTYASSLEYKIENYNLQEGLIEANRCKKEIDKLGYVNVNAIEESLALNERYETLNEQFVDLTKAEEDTSKVIEKLVNSDIAVYELAFKQMTLEEYYLNSTGGNA